MIHDENYYIVDVPGKSVLGFGLSTNGDSNKFTIYNIKNATTFDTNVFMSKEFPITRIDKKDALRIINGETTISDVLNPRRKRSRSASRSRSPASRYMSASRSRTHKGGRRKNGTKRVYRKAK